MSSTNCDSTTHAPYVGAHGTIGICHCFCFGSGELHLMPCVSRAVVLIVLFTAVGYIRADETPRPHLFLLSNAAKKQSHAIGSSALLLDAFRKEIHENESLRKRWNSLIIQVNHDLTTDVVLPGSYLGGGRKESQRQLANRDFSVCFAAGQRIQRAALACVVTGDLRYRDLAWKQIEALFNHPEWSEWQDLAHLGRYPADLRTGMFALDLALAYDWLYDYLTSEQRRWLVDGLDRRAIQPFWQCVERKASWTTGGNNWCTVIVGGIGVLGMSLAGDHPDSQRLVDFSRKRITAYLKDYGSEGEFNESVGYSQSTRLPVTYFAALACSIGNGGEVLSGWPLEQAAVWSAYTYLPPGRYMSFGDGGTDSPPVMSWFGVVGSASNNGVLKWFHEQTSFAPNEPMTELPNGGLECSLPLWILGGDASVQAVNAEGNLPHGRAFQDHGGIVSSRTDWNLHSTPCVVYGKAGIEKYHAHHDAGQLCIDGYGCRLITDLGSMEGYPADYGKNREGYYNSAWVGHNVLTFSERTMKSPTLPVKGAYLAAEFDDQKGGYWQLDLTQFYPGASSVVRTVVHLNPATVAVLDEAEFSKTTGLALRWHTVNPTEADALGRFRVYSNEAQLAGLVTRLDDNIQLSRGEHAYQSPYNVNRYGVPYQSKKESFIHAQWTGKKCRILSLFTIGKKEDAMTEWQVVVPNQSWQITTPQGSVNIVCTQNTLQAFHESTGVQWSVALNER